MNNRPRPGKYLNKNGPYESREIEPGIITALPTPENSYLFEIRGDSGETYHVRAIWAKEWSMVSNEQKQIYGAKVLITYDSDGFTYGAYRATFNG